MSRFTGRVQLIGGDFYYSPNSQRTVHLPPIYNDFPSRDCFSDNFAEFLQPLWWQPACPYLAFVPLRPVFAGVPFQDLFHISFFPRLRYGPFGLDPQIILGWVRLERNIKDAVELLLSHEHAPAITWIAPTSLSCTRYYKRPRDLRASYASSKEWFSLFIAAFSYAIAISLSRRRDDFYDGMPHWFSFLYEREYSQIWLSGIRSSMVATFDSSVTRAGVFVELLEPHREQYSVDWLCKFDVPVWYPWGTREVRASESDARLSRFAPPPHQLQESGTFLTKNPHPQPQPTTEPQTGSYDCTLLSNSSSLSLNLYIYIYVGVASFTLVPSWKAFFEKRRARNERLKARETPKERQSRENREKKPPTEKTKVFMWKRTESGEYRRQSFYQAENERYLGDYGKNQKVYDPFSNEWDCCSEFGEVSQDDVDDADIDEDFEDFSATSPPSDAPVAEPLMPAISEPAVIDRSFSVARPAEISFDWQDFETSKLLYEFYGFVAPLPLPTWPSSISQGERGLISTVVGLTRDDSEFFTSPLASFAHEFLGSLDRSKTVKVSSWDLASGNRMSIAGSELFRRMRVVGNGEEKRYVFDFKDAATVPWMVSLPNVVDALYVCRLDHTGGLRIKDFEVARELLYHGIQFSTLLPISPMPLSTTPPIAVPVRLAGYKFTEEDYYAYEQQRAAFLSDTRVARAALLRGGIVWRLAVATLSFDDVLEGPTTAATLQRRGIVVRTSDNSLELCDDGLSQLELDIICGLYHCHTGFLFFIIFLKSLLTIIYRRRKRILVKIVVAHRQQLAKKCSTHSLDREVGPFFQDQAREASGWNGRTVEFREMAP
jgi:hypothetical protein